MNAEKSNPRARPTGVFQFTVQNYNAKKKKTLMELKSAVLKFTNWLLTLL